MSEVILYILPGMMYFWVLFIGQGPMQEVLHEKHTHILPRMLASPVSVGQYVLAKMLRCFVLCGLALAALMLCSTLLFGVHWGNPLVLGVVLGACALSMTGLLAFVYSLARTREQAGVISSVLLLVLGLVGGSMFPFESLPGFMQVVGQFSPNRWGVQVLQGAARAKPFAELLAPLARLCALGALGSLAAFFCFGRQLAQGGNR